MSGKPNPETPYIVRIHVDKGYRYASTQETIVDPETGKKRYRRAHWGTIEGEENRFIPSKRYIVASDDERARLIFPKDWDMSEAERISAPRAESYRSKSAPKTEDVEAGATIILFNAAIKTGL